MQVIAEISLAMVVVLSLIYGEVMLLQMYRGIHYAKWVYLEPFNMKHWNLFNPRKAEK